MSGGKGRKSSRMVCRNIRDGKKDQHEGNERARVEDIHQESRDNMAHAKEKLDSELLQGSFRPFGSKVGNSPKMGFETSQLLGPGPLSALGTHFVYILF